MGCAKFLAVILLSLLIPGFVCAVPGLPHQFYGYVTVNGNPADNADIAAKIAGTEYGSTPSTNGNYGVSPSIFFVTDPNGNNSGKTIEFFLNGTSVATHAFETGGYTRLDLYIGEAPFCGDGICNAGEDTASCPDDCGAAPVCGDGTCDDGEDCSSCPQDCDECPVICGDGICDGNEDCSNCPADCGQCDTGPVCGDGTCDGGETCTTCTADCGECGGGAPPGGSTSPGSGPSSSGGGGASLQVSVSGNCVGQEVSVTVLNTYGNPAANATVSAVKDRKTIDEKTTAESGIVSFTFDEAGEYTFVTKKNLYNVNYKRVELVGCEAGEGTGTGEEGTGTGKTVTGIDRCAGVDCDDKNPCTTEYCVAATGYCSYGNQTDGTPCSTLGKCEDGVCKEPKIEEAPAAPVLAGFFGLGAAQGAGLGLVIVGLLSAIYLYSASRKKKKK